MKKAYIQPEFDLLKLSSAEDILESPNPSVTIGGEGGDDWEDIGDGEFNPNAGLWD